MVFVTTLPTFWMCLACKCQMTVDDQDLLNKFQELDVQKLETSDRFAEFILIGPGILFEDVFSEKVCANLCFSSEVEPQPVNGWHFSFESDTCTCAWLEPYNGCIDDYLSDVDVEVYDNANEESAVAFMSCYVKYLENGLR